MYVIKNCTHTFILSILQYNLTVIILGFFKNALVMGDGCIYNDSCLIYLNIKFDVVVTCTYMNNNNVNQSDHCF